MQATGHPRGIVAHARPFLAGWVLLAAACVATGQEPFMATRTNELVTPATDLAIARGLAFLATRQQPDGSFGAGTEQFRGNVAIASLAGLAFLSEGSTPHEGPHGERVAAIVAYLLDNAQPSGLIVYGPGAAQRGPMYEHGFATLFLAECLGMSRRPDLRPKLERAVALIVNTQNAEGGWRYQPRRADADMSVTAAQIMALRAARNAGIYVPNATIERCLAYLRACQNPDGGFMYMQPAGVSAFPRSAGGVASLQCVGIHEGPEIEAGFRYLERFTARTGAAAIEPYFFYGHYYAGQVFWLRGGASWARWYEAIRDELLVMQAPNGGWMSPISPDYATACSLIVLQLPNGYLPIFRR